MDAGLDAVPCNAMAISGQGEYWLVTKYSSSYFDKTTDPVHARGRLQQL